MGRNGKIEPEFEPCAVRVVEDLGMSPAEVEQLGFKVVLHWSNVPAVSERDAHAISLRQSMISRQREAERWRREVERAEQMAAEFAATVPRGIPFPDRNMSAVEVMLSVDADDHPDSVYKQLLDEQFAAGRRRS